MAAVMLAGAPLCNEAFAGDKTTVQIANTKLADGVKFILGSKKGTLAKDDVFRTVKNITNAGVDYVTIGDGVKVADPTSPSTLVEEATKAINGASVFEVRNYKDGKFELWVNGKQFVVKEDGNAAATSGKIVKEFVAKKGSSSPAVTTSVDFDDIYTYVLGDAGQRVAFDTNSNKNFGLSINENMTDADLNTYNANSTTFNFGPDAVEGNVFEGVIPVTVAGSKLKSGSKGGTYFVKGADDDVKALKKALDASKLDDVKAAMEKLTVVAVLNDVYGINTGVPGEGYKLAMISGADFYKESKAAAFDNSAFTVKEGDQLNAKDVIDLMVQPKVGDPIINPTVAIAAVKASASDPKTYVTTVGRTSTSKFAKVTKPMMGDNTYFAAAEFLKAGEVSAYNIYFTSGEQSTANNATEYHKYLVRTSTGPVTSPATVAFQNSALAAKGVDLTSPAAQWIVMDFDGKYTLTLQNRLTNETLKLRLAATSNKGEYKINSADGAVTSAIAGLDSALDIKGMTIKLVPASLTKYDGAMAFSENQMKEGVTLAFSGKNAAVGAQDFYAYVKNAGSATSPNYTLAPTLTEGDAATLNVKEAGKLMNITKFAYLDDKGAVATNDVAKADTLVVPAYNFSIKIEGKNYVVNQTTSPANPFGLTQVATGVTPKNYFIAKTANGSYTLSSDPALGATNYTSFARATNNAIGVNATSTADDKVVANFATVANQAFAPANAGFVKLNVDLNKSYYTSLEAASRHATFENALGSVSMQVNKKGILEGILAAEPTTFWLDTADSETKVPSFYISKGIKAAEETKAYSDEVRNFLVYAPDSMRYFDEASATVKKNTAYQLEGTSSLKAFFHPAALIAEDTMTTVVKGKEVTVVTKDADAAKNQKNALKNFQFGIRLADEDVADEYVIYSKANPSAYLYSHNGKLGFGSATQALVVKLGEGDATANEAIAAENNVAVIGGEGVVTVKGAAGKQVVVSNILGQVIANKVATSDEETIAVAAGVAVVVVDGEATKVVVK